MARIITFVIFGGFGFVMLYVGVTQFFMQRRLLANAQRVDARIIHSEVFTSTSADTDPRPLRSTSTTTHRPDVKFRYQVAGAEYESDFTAIRTEVRRKTLETALLKMRPGRALSEVAAKKMKRLLGFGEPAFDLSNEPHDARLNNQASAAAPALSGEADWNKSSSSAT